MKQNVILKWEVKTFHLENVKTFWGFRIFLSHIFGLKLFSEFNQNSRIVSESLILHCWRNKLILRKNVQLDADGKTTHVSVSPSCWRAQSCVHVRGDREDGFVTMYLYQQPLWGKKEWKKSRRTFFLSLPFPMEISTAQHIYLVLTLGVMKCMYFVHILHKCKSAQLFWSQSSCNSLHQLSICPIECSLWDSLENAVVKGVQITHNSRVFALVLYKMTCRLCPFTYSRTLQSILSMLSLVTTDEYSLGSCIFPTHY